MGTLWAHTGAIGCIVLNKAASNILSIKQGVRRTDPQQLRFNFHNTISHTCTQGASELVDEAQVFGGPGSLLVLPAGAGGHPVARVQTVLLEVRTTVAMEIAVASAPPDAVIIPRATHSSPPPVLHLHFS